VLIPSPNAVRTMPPPRGVSAACMEPV